MAQILNVQQQSKSSDRILRNLFEHYLHDMAEWFDFDTESDGSYDYDTDHLWSGQVDVYFAYVADIPIGFALVGSARHWLGQEGCDLEEFFVVRKHRRQGIGKAFARHIWDRYPGYWLVRVYTENRPALPFWRSTIAAYTDNTHHEQKRDVDAKPWSYFTFSNDV